MNTRFEELLEKLDSFWRQTSAPILKRLNEGVAEEKIKATIHDRWLPEEIFQLYKWHDGTNMNGDGTLGEYWLFPMGTFMSTARVMECHEKRVGQDGYWESDKLPLFESRGGEYFLIDIDKKSKTSGMIFYHSLGAVHFDTLISKYDSLETLFETVVRCFQEGAYFYNAVSHQLGFNYDLEKAITREYNPRSEYWKLF